MNQGTSTPEWGSNATAQAYEELRGEALVDSPRPVGSRGMALLMRRGMAAWARTWSSSVIVAAINTSARTMAPVQRDAAVALLADMIFSASRQQETA